MRVCVAVLCATVAVGCAAGSASAHKGTKAPMVHAIDHLRWKTNALRRDAGLRPLRGGLAYRRNDDRAFRLRAHARWLARLREARRLLPPLGSVWIRLAECESEGNWRYNGPSGFDGGLQFHPGTWAAYRPRRFPPYAYLATPRQQVAVARRVLAAEGWNAWPACSAALGLR